MMEVTTMVMIPIVVPTIPIFVAEMLPVGPVVIAESEIHHWRCENHRSRRAHLRRGFIDLGCGLDTDWSRGGDNHRRRQRNSNAKVESDARLRSGSGPEQYCG